MRMLLWAAAGAAWVVECFLSWTRSGLLAASSMLDAARLIRSGVLGALAPGWVAYALLVLPACGVVLLGTAPVRRRWAVRARWLVALVGVLAAGAALHVLVGWSPARLGPGGWLAVLGSGLALAGFVLDIGHGDATGPPH